MSHIPRRFWRKLTKTKIYDILPDDLAVKIKYRNHFLKKLDLKNPQTFNEKLQWLKLYDRKPEYALMADKLASKEYAAGIIGEEYIIPTFGSWDSFDDIDFNSLPNQFVLKCNHSSGDTVICKEKSTLDKVTAKRILEDSLNTDYYKISREWVYKDIPRKILAEKYLIDDETNEARDYKFFCFSGKVKCFKVDFGRFKDHRANWYYCNGELVHYGEEICPPDFSANITLPKQVPTMIDLAQKLSKGIPFLRVDFYCVNSQIYLGELTFYPASGLLRFTDAVWDKQMGDCLTLPSKCTD